MSDRQHLIETIRRLRRLVSSLDDAHIALAADFNNLDPSLEADAAPLRPLIDDVSKRLYGFLERYEAASDVVAARTDVLTEKYP